MIRLQMHPEIGRMREPVAKLTTAQGATKAVLAQTTYITPNF